MNKYLLTIAYDGTNYVGWQVQPNGLSIQTVVGNALNTILREKTDLTGATRTDSGVHAKGQTAHFQTPAAVNIRQFLYSINALLPADIRVIKMSPVPTDFHARYHAISKTYHYHLWLEPFVDPTQRLYVTHVRKSLDLFCLQEAAALLIGTHDFSAFANHAHQGAASKDPVRTLYRIDVVPQIGGIRIEFTGDGFLYKMVRNMVGTLLDVASGTLSLNDMQRAFSARDRRLAGQAAPAQGLFLMEVHYE